ncbi:MAG: prolipoprotein diacylglyceryl transferase [Dehalococcoidales bacterium]|nr:prolipoprotein diacylglyceryl transferase [Dehalococcoidales bacterium]
MIKIGVDPVIFSIGPFHPGWYGLAVSLGIMFVVFWAAYEIKKGARISYDNLLMAAIVGIPTGIVFARLVHVIDQWEYYSRNLGSIIGGEGLSIYGGVLGALLGIWIYSRYSKFNFGHLLDIVAPGIAMGQAIGRVGCTLNGCCYGDNTTVPWGIEYTNPNSYGYGAGVVHPTQVYEVIFMVILFGILYKLRGRLKPDGSLAMVYFAGYAVWRFFVDFIREGTPFLFGLHQAQVIAIVILIVIIALAIKNKVGFVKKTDMVEKEEEEVGDGKQ